ncbi:electron transfer flavoprotein subunit beta [Pseudogulbenkiania ferrooxidans]|uniref:Electron transfer flavoprotein beta-subunit n=1 Tax=Pseudogulbenkiania ferrooxidans 2002 TaxID=279714 RepID=B9Z0C5_9NEIS|nr:electron transfer flavoprotein subunit beta [Pseudogulbenkiania ferrooxidans]EEG10008.1 electron transfer flavoprotein beta-subunit [Pseudogulbenkiania ferrooxidans 2002]
MSTPMLKVAVLVAPAIHPVSGRPCTHPADSAALALGLKLAGSSERLTVLYAGAAADEALAGYLAQGASCVTVLPTAEDADIAPLLAAQIADAELVLCGTRAGGGQGSALLPYQLAEELEAPLLPDALSVAIKGGSVEIEQFLPKGQRRSLAAALPVVVTVHERAVPALPYSHARKEAGKVRRLMPVAAKAAEWRYEPAGRRARPLVAASRASGHERMLGAIAADDGKTTGLVVKQGDPVEKAQVLLDYLRDHQLVDF